MGELQSQSDCCALHLSVENAAAAAAAVAAAMQGKALDVRESSHLHT